MIEKIDIKEVFNLNHEDRTKLIQESMDYLVEMVKVEMVKNNMSFKMGLSYAINNVNKSKQIALENENYELCYIYDEITWNMDQKIKSIIAGDV